MRIFVIAESDSAFAWLLDAFATGGSFKPVRAIDEAHARSSRRSTWGTRSCVFDRSRPPWAMNVLKERVEGVDPPW